MSIQGIKPLYSFHFFAEEQRGTVHVYPACAFVKWAGMEFESDAAANELAEIIFKARLAHSRSMRVI